MACTEILPAVNFVDDCQTIKKGQVYRLLMTLPGTENELADSTDLDEWTLRIDQSATAPSGAENIRNLSGIGSLAAGEVSESPIPLDQVYSTPGNKVLSFKILDMTEENIAMLIALRDAGTTRKKIWFIADDLLYGGDAGWDVSCRADVVIPEGRTDWQYGEMVFTSKKSLNAAVASPFTVL